MIGLQRTSALLCLMPVLACGLGPAKPPLPEVWSRVKTTYPWGPRYVNSWYFETPSGWDVVLDPAGPTARKAPQIRPPDLPPDHAVFVDGQSVDEVADAQWPDVLGDVGSPLRAKRVRAVGGDEISCVVASAQQTVWAACARVRSTSRDTVRSVAYVRAMPRDVFAQLGGLPLIAEVANRAGVIDYEPAKGAKPAD